MNELKTVTAEITRWDSGFHFGIFQYDGKKIRVRRSVLNIARAVVPLHWVVEFDPTKICNVVLPTTPTRKRKKSFKAVNEVVSCTPPKS